MRDFILTAHAEKVLIERGISLEWVEVALYSPDEILPDRDDPHLSHALKRIPEFGNRILRVVFNKVSSPTRVVTAYFDRTLKR